MLDVAIRDQKCCLYYVLSTRIIIEHPACEAESCILIRQDQLVEGIQIILLC